MGVAQTWRNPKSDHTHQSSKSLGSVADVLASMPGLWTTKHHWVGPPKLKILVTQKKNILGVFFSPGVWATPGNAQALLLALPSLQTGSGDNRRCWGLNLDQPFNF